MPKQAPGPIATIPSHEGHELGKFPNLKNREKSAIPKQVSTSIPTSTATARNFRIPCFAQKKAIPDPHGKGKGRNEGPLGRDPPAAPSNVPPTVSDKELRVVRQQRRAWCWSGAVSFRPRRICAQRRHDQSTQAPAECYVR